MKKFLGILLSLALILSLAACNRGGATQSGGGGGGSNVLKIGAITSLSGALQGYGEDFQRGFLLGLEHMTNGTNIVAGRPLEIIWEDTTNTPDVARERTMQLLERDRVELVVGYASSGDAVASMPLFEEFETVAIIEPAAADAIIQRENWNEYIFRTGRTSSQDALALISVLRSRHPDGNARVATFAPDTTFGYSMANPFVETMRSLGFTVTNTEFAPQDANDFSPFFLRLRAAAPDYLYVIWAGANSPWTQLLELDLTGAGIQLITGAPDLPQLRGMVPLGQTGAFGFCVYYPTLPQNEPLNDWMVRRHQEVYGLPADLFTSGGFAAAVAMCTALEKTGGRTEARLLIDTMRGMEFDSPTGKRWFRPQDHQAMQDLYEVEITWQTGLDHALPVFSRVIRADEITPPVMNGR